MWEVIPRVPACYGTGLVGGASRVSREPRGHRHQAITREPKLLRSVRSNTQAVSERGGCERSSGAGLLSML